MLMDTEAPDSSNNPNAWRSWDGLQRIAALPAAEVDDFIVGLGACSQIADELATSAGEPAPVRLERHRPLIEATLANDPKETLHAYLAEWALRASILLHEASLPEPPEATAREYAGVGEVMKTAESTLAREFGASPVHEAFAEIDHLVSSDR